METKWSIPQAKGGNVTCLFC